MHTEGRFALVTGAARGIGRAIVVKLLEKGAAGVCLVDINATQLALTTEELKVTFPAALVCCFAADVSDLEQLERAFSYSKEQFGKLHIVANNAGVGKDDNLPLMAAVNLVAPCQGILLGLQHMGLDKSGGEGGVIINTASIAGIIMTVTPPMYTATKFGLVALTRAMGNAECLSRTGVRINCLCPTLVDTDLLRDALQQGHEDIKQAILSRMMKPEVVAEAFLNLVHDDEANGKALKVKGPADFQYHVFQQDEALF